MKKIIFIALLITELSACGVKQVTSVVLNRRSERGPVLDATQGCVLRESAASSWLERLFAKKVSAVPLPPSCCLVADPVMMDKACLGYEYLH